MSESLKVGDHILISDREPSATDVKSGLYYNHYRGLTGLVAKLYEDQTASIEIDSESLPTDVRERHESGTAAERQKWLDKLSEEARNRLTAAEKKFAWRYTILVSLSDITHLHEAAEKQTA